METKQLGHRRSHTKYHQLQFMNLIMSQCVRLVAGFVLHIFYVCNLHSASASASASVSVCVCLSI